MRFSLKLNVHALSVLLCALTAATARDIPTPSAEKGAATRTPPELPTLRAAPTPAVTFQGSACVTKCFNKATAQGKCSSIVDALCFCANLELAATLSSCIKSDCPDEAQAAFGIYTQTCSAAASLFPSGFLPTLPLGAPPTIPPTSVAAPTPSTDAASKPAVPSSAVPAPPATANGSASAGASTEAPPAASATQGQGGDSASVGTKSVTVTVSDANPDSTGTALNPPAQNGAGRQVGCGALTVAGGVLLAFWSI